MGRRSVRCGNRFLLLLAPCALLSVAGCDSTRLNPSPTTVPGEQGPAGPIGPTGPAGPAGPQGDPGDAGPQGARGNDGPAGPPGPSGAVLLVSTVDGGSVSIDGGFAIIAGPQGPPGPQGVQGLAGGAGQPGPQGVSGSAGAPGRDGDQFGEIAARFAGFTAQTTNGAAGGRHAMHGLCQQAFAGSHMCHAAEFARSNSTVDIPDGGAWVDLSATINLSAFGREFASVEVSTADSVRAVLPIAQSCNDWTSAGVPPMFQISGGRVTAAAPGTTTCDSVLPVACCSTPYRERFAGFTTSTTDGNIGGRAAANRRCAAEFPGAHLCHVAEYVRANVAVAPPSGGAWIDKSSLAPVFASSSTQAEAVVTRNGHGRASPYVTSGPGLEANCVNWTSNASTADALALVPSGIQGSSNCDVVRSLACCL